MRQSVIFSSTIRDIPADTEAKSHQLMLRAGYIRMLAAGIYTFLPLGLRVLKKIEQIVREEMDKAGAQEILMPALQPAELWKESGRYGVYGPELIRLKDRHNREFALGPTHEEVITALVRNEINSYRRLPIILYQIQSKFRDERRPRFGLLRCREFLMKDAYSFDAVWEGLNKSYKTMYNAYSQIFSRCGLNFRAVEADPGAIGGEGGSHEFMALAEIGEDTIVSCSQCEYAANLEKAQAGEADIPEDAETQYTENIERIHTPGIRTIDELTRFLGVKAQNIVKTLIYIADGNPVAVLVRGDHEANEIKLKDYLKVENIVLADQETTSAATGAPVGFAGPVGINAPILVDTAVARMRTCITGGNKADFHFRCVIPGRDFDLQRTGDFRNAAEGDPCPRCGEGVLRFDRGIEVGHVFKLGTKYSESLGARYLNTDGKEIPMIMGCYGIGLPRLLSAIIEQNYDSKAMLWPLSVAPYQVHIIPIAANDSVQARVADNLYEGLCCRGIEALLDDRNERAGVKFNDADLLGIPIRVIVGRDAAKGNVEYIDRRNQLKEVLPDYEALNRIVERVMPSSNF